MAVLRSFATSMLLSALLVIASATDYGMVQHQSQRNQNPKHITNQSPQNQTMKFPNQKKKMNNNCFPQSLLSKELFNVNQAIINSQFKRGAGAVARVTCRSVDERGYEAAPISVLSHITDSKGYFFATLSLAELGSDSKLAECKAFLESSPLETCRVPTDVNYGISGARFSSYRPLNKKIKLYTVGPFVCTSQPKPAPIGC